MSQVITTKKINLDQLGYESKIDMNTIFEPTGEVTICSSVEQSILESFIKNHTADDLWQNPTPIESNPNVAAKLALLAKLGITADELKLLFS